MDMWLEDKSGPDPLEEFLAQLLKDFPDVLPEPITVSPASLSLQPPLPLPFPISLPSPPLFPSPPSPPPLASPSSLSSSPSSPLLPLSPSLSSLSPSSSPSSSSPSPSPSSPPSPSAVSSVSTLWSYWSPPPPSYPSARSRYRTPDAHPSCQWVSSPDSPLSCGARVSTDPKQVCTHFRNAHGVRGNEKVIISCQWRDCRAAPMQRGSLIRHVLTVHLGLMRWRCDRCRKMFSRRGTVHLCAKDA